MHTRTVEATDVTDAIDATNATDASDASDAHADLAGPSSDVAQQDAPPAAAGTAELDAEAPPAVAPDAGVGTHHRPEALRALVGQFEELPLKELREATRGCWLSCNNTVEVPKAGGGRVLGKGGYGEVRSSFVGPKHAQIARNARAAEEVLIRWSVISAFDG